MTTVTRKTPRVKVSYPPELLVTPETRDGLYAVALADPSGRSGETLYWLRRIGSDFGDGFELTKFTPSVRGDGDEQYHVHLSNEGHTCECKGFLRWGRCKHVDALVCLREQGLI